MSDTVKLIIEIPKETKQEFDKTESIVLKGAYFDLDGIIGKAIQNGISLDDVKAEIGKCKTQEEMQLSDRDTKGKLFISDIFCHIIEILDNIGKAESEDKE